MRKMFRFCVVTIVGALPCAFASTGLAAEIALVPVSADRAHVIVGDTITVPAGTNVVFEIHASGWDPNLTGMPLLRAYQMELDDATYSSGTTGTLSPARVTCLVDATCIAAFGGACSLAGDACSSDADCSFAQFGEVCAGPTCSFFVGGNLFCTPGFIANKQADYIFKGLPDFPVVDLSAPGVRFASALLSDFPPDPGSVTYTGTLVLEVPADATGTFTVGFASSPGTFLLDADSNFVEPTALTPARVVIGAAPCGSSLDCDDNNLCTDDTCFGGVCSNAPNFDDTIRCCNPGTGSLCGTTRGIPGDGNRDGVIDLSDFLLVQTCFGLLPFPAECVPVDLSCDCNVNLDDVAGFVNVLGGP